MEGSIATTCPTLHLGVRGELRSLTVAQSGDFSIVFLFGDWGREVKMGNPRDITPGHPQAELGLSHMLLELGSNPQR